MKNIDEINCALLEECCHKCLDVYNRIFGRTFDYDELFFLSELKVPKGSEQLFNEMNDISFELQKACIVIEDESEEEKIEQKNILENIKQRLSEITV